MDVKNLVDVSSFFLFEATGDSEAAVLDPGMPDDVNHSNEDDDGGGGGGGGDDDDDAGSCVCDASEIHMVSKIYEGDVRQVSDDEEEENGEVVEQDVRGWDKDQHIVLQTEQTSRVSGDSKKTMNEREESKLFWETCLAS